MTSIFDSKEVILVDIDGTLVDVTPLHVSAYRDAFQRVAGITIRDPDHLIREWGKPEAEVMASVLRTYGLTKPPGNLISKLIDAYTKNVVRFAPTISPRNVIVGARPLLIALKASGKKLVVISGNPKKIGDVLLERAGLLPFFDAAAYSDEGPNGTLFTERFKILELGLRRIAQKQKKRVPLKAAMIIGDAPSDIKAAQKIGMDSLAVATGRYSRKQLEAYSPTRCVGTLKNEKVSIPKKTVPKKILVTRRKVRRKLTR